MTNVPTTDDMQTAAGLAGWSTDEWREWYYTIRAEVRAQALSEAADELDLPGSTATGYYASEQDSGYRDAERDAEQWLRARAEQTKEDR